ncbi:MAG: type II toxin-antitoxin system RelE/ParE family toxin [Geobacter sp.]|nr:MAG: type II toxin-antitoxin system RelE/ParE family toxin [Geobacter sp.]
MRYRLFYYNEEVEEEFAAWPVGLRARFRALTIRIEIHGPNLGMPHTRALGHGLFEIRAKGEEGIGRAFFCTLVGRKIIILHGFIKKTEKTPKQEIVKARVRQMEVQGNEL